MKRFLLVFALILILIEVVPVSAAHADEKAEALLKKLAETTQTTQTLAADLELSYQTPGKSRNKSTGTLRLMRPNFAHITLTGEPIQTLASDGKTLYTLSAANRYERKPADPQGSDIVSPWWGLPFRYFFTRTLGLYGPVPEGTAKNRYVGIEHVNGETLDVVEQTVTASMPYTLTLYIGTDNLLRRTIVRFGQGAGAASFEATLTNIQTNKIFSATDFQYVLPVGAQPATAPEADLLAIGSSAPTFTLLTSEGKSLTLAEVSKGSKATLVNFWYANCSPCRAEFPYLQQLYNKIKSEGFAVIAIDYDDSAASVRDFIRQNKVTFPVVVGQSGPSSVFSKYKVMAFPTTYLLDAHGTVIKRFVGFDAKQGLQDLEAALKQVGFHL